MGRFLRVGNRTTSAARVAAGGPRSPRADECRSSRNGILPAAADAGRKQCDGRSYREAFSLERFRPVRGRVAPRRSLRGYVGLHAPTFEAHFTPCVEIGWRFASDVW